MRKCWRACWLIVISVGEEDREPSLSIAALWNNQQQQQKLT